MKMTEFCCFHVRQFYPAELASVIYGTFYTVIIRGDFIENWIIADDTKVLSDDFVMKWA